MAHDVFISYATSDKPVADAVCAGLEARGLRCWIAPRDILPGLDWGAALIDAITECKAMVLVFSASANSSKQIKREVERAVAKGVTIIPLRIEDVPLGKTLEYFISTPHWMDALSRPLEPHIDRLAQTIRSLLARPSRSTGGVAVPNPAEAPAIPPPRIPPPPPPARPTSPPARPSGAAATPAAPAGKLRPAHLLAGAAVLLGLLVVFGLFHSSAPQIVSLQFPSQIFANNQPAQGVILFKTSKADLAAARFDVVQAANFPPISFPLRSVGQKEGSVGFFLQTSVPQHVVLQAVLIDRAGRESRPVKFAFDVAPAPVNAPAARRKYGPRGIEIQAPNGFRFRLPR